MHYPPSRARAWRPALALGVFAGAALAAAFAPELGSLARARQDAQPGTARSSFQDMEAQRVAQMQKDVLGAWMLERFEHATQVIEQSDVRGAAMFTEGFLCVIMHAREDNNSIVGPRYNMLQQSGMYQVRFIDNARLQASTIMGSSNFSGDFEYETAYAPREYDVQLAGDALVLVRPDASKLHFRRMRAQEFPAETLRLLEEARVEKR
jgi:hypothetical protein